MMDKQLIERLAREAGLASERSPDGSFIVSLPESDFPSEKGGVFFDDGFPDSLLRFAALIAGECAKVADSVPVPCDDMTSWRAAAAIRAKFSPVTVRITANLNEAEVWQDGELIGRVTGIGEDDKG
jgi:hypothetical protein